MNGYIKEDISITIGKNIKAARNARGWKQSELAERSGRLSRETIGKIESFNATNISVSTISIIAETFGVPVYMLMLRGTDWKNIGRIPKLSGDIEAYFENSSDIISPKYVDEIEEMAKSVLKKERRESVAKAKAVAERIRGVQPCGKDTLSTGVDESVTAGIAMAMAMNPNDPILNSLIASMISA